MKVAKPVEDPLVLASDLASPSSPITDAPVDLPVDVEANPPEPSFDETTVNPSATGPSSSANPPSPSA